MSQEAASIATPPSRNADDARRWRWPFLLVAICVLILLVSLRQTAGSMLHTWQSSKTYSHCFLIVPLFAYMVWIRRRRILAVRPRPSFWGVACLGILLVMWLLGDLGEARVVQELALVAAVAAVIWALLGVQALNALRLPLLFLFFAVPFGVTLVPPLQDLTAWFAFHGLALSQVPAVLENRTISLPNGVWTIAETCSGIRYLFASIVVGVFYSSLVYRSRLRQLIFLAASIVVPIAANAFRAYGIVLVGYLSNNKIATGVDHIIYGGVFFVVIQLALLAVGLRWREETLAGSPALPDESPHAAPHPGKLWGAAFAMVVILFSAPFLAQYLWNRSGAALAPEGLTLDLDPSWGQINDYDSSWDPQLRGPDREMGQEYEATEHRVHFYWALYSGQRGTELPGAMGYGNPGLWNLAYERRARESLDGQRVPVDERLYQAGLNTRSVWTMYWVAGEYTASPTRVKLLQAKARLGGKSAAVVVIVMGSEDPENHPHTAEQALQDFLAHASIAITTPS